MRAAPPAMPAIVPGVSEDSGFVRWSCSLGRPVGEVCIADEGIGVVDDAGAKEDEAASNEGVAAEANGDVDVMSASVSVGAAGLGGG